jgi:hypothetical protein
MRKVAVISTGYPKHADNIQHAAHNPVEQRRACPDGSQRNQVDNCKRDLLFQDRLAPHFRCYGGLTHFTANRIWNVLGSSSFTKFAGNLQFQTDIRQFLQSQKAG